jgi:AraC-like DNA-binding protein
MHGLCYDKTRNWVAFVTAVPQVRSSAYLPFVKFFELAGEPVRRGLVGELIPAVARKDSEALVPIHLAHAYLERGARKFGQPDLGILVGENMKIADLGAFGRSLLRSLTLHDALNKFPAFYSQFSSAEKIWWTRKGETAQFLHSYLQEPGIGSRYARHCALLLMRDLIRMAAGPCWQPDLVLITDSDDFAILRGAFGDPEFRLSDASGLSFPAILLCVPLTRDNGASFAYRDHNAFDSSNPSKDFVGSLKQVIATFVSEGHCGLEQVARALEMHPRTLQRKLSAHGREYSELLSQVRFDLALRLMDDPSVRILDIALELGFRDASNFSRSFRQWTGVTATKFRAMRRDT